MKAAAESLACVPARSLVEVFTVLRGLRRRFDRIGDLPLPLLTVNVRGAAMVTGFFVDLSEAPEATLLMQNEINDRPGDDLIYITAAAIAGIRVHNAERVAHEFAGGGLSAPLGPAPSTIDLKRLCASVTEKLGERAVACEVDIVWSARMEGESARRRIAAAIGDAASHLVGLADDAESAVLIADSVTRLRFVWAARERIALERRTLQIEAPFDAAMLASAGLREKIAAAL